MIVYMTEYVFHNPREKNKLYISILQKSEFVKFSSPPSPLLLRGMSEGQGEEEKIQKKPSVKNGRLINTHY